MPKSGNSREKKLILEKILDFLKMLPINWASQKVFFCLWVWTLVAKQFPEIEFRHAP